MVDKQSPKEFILLFGAIFRMRNLLHFDGFPAEEQQSNQDL